MVGRLRETAPSVDPAMVLITGAAELSKHFPADVLPGVLQAYMWGIKVTFAIAIAGSGIAFFVGLGSRWSKLNREKIEGVVPA